jgi:hypothetical protein
MNITVPIEEEEEEDAQDDDKTIIMNPEDVLKQEDTEPERQEEIFDLTPTDHFAYGGELIAYRPEATRLIYQVSDN